MKTRVIIKVKLKCPTCGKEFVINSKQYGKQKYCSVICGRAFRWKLGVGRDILREMERSRRKSRRKFLDKIKEGKILEKEKKIKTKIKKYKEVNFKKSDTITKITGISSCTRARTRELIRIRDKHTCQLCGKVWEVGQRRFDVHHIDCDKEKSRQCDNYEKEKDNMITLCHKCHLNLPEHRNAMSGKRTSFSTDYKTK